MLLGVIADDLTGATDVALMLTAGGMRTLQVMDPPTATTNLDGYDAVVVALKSRTNPPAEAVQWSLAALDALKARGARQILFKYCSTFDSTAEGNIGPVADALMERLGATLAIVCTAFPRNGRTIYKGNLFVGDVRLDDSPMKDHPLTPMRDANLVRLMTQQSRHPVGLVPHAVIDQGREAIAKSLVDMADRGFRYVVTDAIDDRHLIETGLAVADMALVTGGSGIAMGLPAAFERAGVFKPRVGGLAFAPPAGRAVIIAGSCSAATRGQIEVARVHGLPMFEVKAADAVNGGLTSAEVAAWVLAQPATSTAVLYSSADPAVVAEAQRAFGKANVSHAVERLLAATAKALALAGVTRFVVAGGETSGAVVAALGVNALEIGPEIAPGVPWTLAPHSTATDRPLALALKSGNFGGPTFFLDAIRATNAQ